MAELIIQVEKIQNNIKFLSNYFDERNVHWSLITKVFSGDKEFLKKVLTEDVIKKISSVGDSRLTSLKNLKELNPNMRTIYIKPPAKVYADDIVKYADISLNSSLPTIKALNEAAKKAGKTHQIIIMIELGELREGVNRDEIMGFYEKVFNLPHIEVVGIGSNLGCMYGVAPSYDKLLQLALYKELISAKFNKNLKLISGGTSITMPMLDSGNIPKEVNHFRVGEAAFFGVTPLKNEQFKDLSLNTFELTANVIELAKKEVVPEGTISDANIGHTASFDENEKGGTSVKAILDFGILDVDSADIDPYDEDIHFVGITSDMLVVDIGTNRTKDGKIKYKEADTLRFKPNYMAVARLLNSKFIAKRYV